MLFFGINPKKENMKDFNNIFLFPENRKREKSEMKFSFWFDKLLINKRWWWVEWKNAIYSTVFCFFVSRTACFNENLLLLASAIGRIQLMQSKIAFYTCTQTMNESTNLIFQTRSHTIRPSKNKQVNLVLLLSSQLHICCIWWLSHAAHNTNYITFRRELNMCCSQFCKQKNEFVYIIPNSMRYIVHILGAH